MSLVSAVLLRPTVRRTTRVPFFDSCRSFRTPRTATRPASGEPGDVSTDGGGPETAGPSSPKPLGRRARRLASEAARRSSKKRAEKPFSPIRSKPVTVGVVEEVVDPLLSDLEKLRPVVLLDPKHPDYPKLYERTFLSIEQSFVKDQLIHLMRKIGLTPGHGVKTKPTLIKKIMVHWKLLEPVLVKQESSAEEMAEKDFALLPSELFLLMGSDGSDLLRLSHKYQARLTPIPDPLRLRAYGPVAALNQMAAEIEEKKTEMISTTAKLECAAGVRPDLVQTISRISGAFIENTGEATIKITGLDQEACETARRLAERAGIDAKDTASRPLVAHLAPRTMPRKYAHLDTQSTNQYALYPFLSPGILPWTMGFSNPFRVRHLGDWLSEEGRAKADTGLSAGEWIGSDGASTTLREALLGSLPPLQQGWVRTISATPGYHLVSAPGSESLARVSLVPPIRDPFKFKTFMDWLAAGSGRTTFLQGAPSSIRAETLKPRRLAVSEDVILYRLRYQARQESSRPPLAGSAADTPPEGSIGGRRGVLDVQVNLTRWSELARSKSTGGWSPFVSPQSGSPSSVEEEEIARFDSVEVVTARRGFASGLDVLLPDRHLDMRLSVSDFSKLPRDMLPKILAEHLTDCHRAHEDNMILPASPFTITLDEVTYDLVSNEVVRSSQREQTNATRIMDGGSPHGNTAIVVIEKVADVDSKQQSLQCRVYASEPRRNGMWSAFLAQCEEMTMGPQKEFTLNLLSAPRQVEKQKMYA